MGYDEGYYRRNITEYQYKQVGLLRPDQYAAACYTLGLRFDGADVDTPRYPGVITSIGCGDGVLERFLEDLGYTVIGVDPSPGAQALYQGTVLVDRYPGHAGTVLFVESVEHLPGDVFDDIWARIPAGTRVVFTNWVGFHPIEPDGTGWDHITRIDDAFYDRLCEGHRVVKRNGSHLVLEREQ
jgi:SAM-dependent methyltransferase